MKVFISSSFADQEWVQEFVTHLRSAGLDARGRSEGNFKLGENVMDSFRRNLESADVVVPVLTEWSLHNANVLFEMGVAKGVGKPIVPVLIAEPGTPAKIPRDLLGQNFITTDSPRKAADLLQQSLARLMVGA